MKQKLFSEILALYKSRKNNSYTIRFKMRLKDSVDFSALKYAVDNAMKRYPYFCVKLSKEDDEFIFEDNLSPLVIADSLDTELNSDASNYHLISFSYFDDWIVADIFHGLTDGAGAYELIRTLLYYYCSRRYNKTLSSEGIRAAEDKISLEEWECPVMKATNLPTPKRYDIPPALNPMRAANIRTEDFSTVYGILLDEAEFMRFNRENGASPATMVSLLLSRAVKKLFPNAKEAIRVILTVNQRKALNAPLAHQSLAGGALLEYKEDFIKLPLREQIRAYREMVSAQTTKESALSGVSNIANLTKMLIAKNTDEERLQLAASLDKLASDIGSACVSYVGKANFGEAERYLREFHTWSYSTLPITVQMSVVNGKFTFDFIQKFSGRDFINAFLNELDELKISYDFQDGVLMKLPNIKLPWYKE